MNPQCFECGRFIKLDQGDVICIERFDGKPNQYFCPRCTPDTEGKVTFRKEWKDIGTVRFV